MINIDNLNKEILKKAKLLLPNIKRFYTIKECEAYFKGDDDFITVTVSNFTETSLFGTTLSPSLIALSTIEYKEFFESINKYNTYIRNLQMVESNKMNFFERRRYLNKYKPGVNLGICNLTYCINCQTRKNQKHFFLHRSVYSTTKIKNGIGIIDMNLLKDDAYFIKNITPEKKMISILGLENLFRKTELN